MYLSRKSGLKIVYYYTITNMLIISDKVEKHQYFVST